GFMDYTSEAQQSVRQLVLGAIAGTPAAARDFNPLTATDPLGVLNRIAATFRSMPSSGGGGAAGVGMNELTSIAAGGTIVTRSPVHVTADRGGVDIPSGGVVSVRVQGAGSVGAVIGGASPQAQADAAQIQSISVESHSITIMSGGKPAARLDRA